MEERLQSSQIPYLTQDYLVFLYQDYLNPRDKIKNLVKKGDLIPIKRELYLLGEKYLRLYSKETIANIIFGPSAISYEYALSFHGLIPERVETVTSICFKRNKEFSTPIGTFTYKYIPLKNYPLGIKLHESTTGNFLMATPEKALCDLVYLQKIETKNDAWEFVIENLRIDEDQFLKLDTDLLHKLSEVYKRANVANLLNAHVMSKEK